MKQTRQAVRAIKQSILLRCLWHVWSDKLPEEPGTVFTTFYCHCNLQMGPIS